MSDTKECLNPIKIKSKSISSSSQSAFKNLLSMIREFELVYNLSPELDETDKYKLIQEVSRIFNAD
jgi:hypothetical protein